MKFKQLIILRKKEAPAWNSIFFQVSQRPEIISTIDLDYAKAKNYFPIID